MDKTIHRKPIRGTVNAPASKSYAQRALAAALLCNGETTLTGMSGCNDTDAARGVVESLGAEVECEGDQYRVRGGLNPKGTSVDIGESGLATRLFTPIASLLDREVTITGHGSILKRPIDMIEAPLRELGVEIKSKGGYLPLKVKGPMRGGEITADGSLSSQFISGLLMSLPLAPEDSTLHVPNLKSIPYVDMTIEVVRAFGIDIRHEKHADFYICGGQKYHPITYNVEGDWSGASCLLVGGAIGEEITMHNLNISSSQADVAILGALSLAGAEVTTTYRSVTVRRRELNAFEFDATHCPDLFPALALLASCCYGESIIRGTERLTFKESDRARTIAATFEAMGIEVDISEKDVMKITGGDIRSAEVDSHNDHRIAMAAAVAATVSDGSVTIHDSDAVNKSYPGFWDDLEVVTGASRHTDRSK